MWKPHLMLIDTTRTISTSIVTLLIQYGFEVTLTTAIKAQYKLRVDPHHYDLLILDHELLQQENMGLMQYLQKTASIKHIPIIVAASHAHQQLMAITNQLIQVIAKPIIAEHLLGAINHALRNQQLRNITN